jgi:hypothetical protein
MRRGVQRGRLHSDSLVRVPAGPHPLVDPSIIRQRLP